MPQRLPLAACLAAALLAGGCKVVPTAQKAAVAETPGSSFENASFDPDKMAADMWSPKVLPYVTGKAAPFADVVAAIKANPDEAGKKYGYREQASAPWTVLVHITGRIVAAETASRAGTLSIDTDNDGKADAVVQIGPAVRGTALRDSLDFVSFNAFTNQIDYARFGKSLNKHVDTTTLSKLTRDKLIGRTVDVVGAFPVDPSVNPPLVTPAIVTLGDAP